VIVGKERSRRENVDDDISPKGTVTKKSEGRERKKERSRREKVDDNRRGRRWRERKFVQLMEHHKSEGETEFLTEAGKL
jgi:hypothetical protein